MVFQLKDYLREIFDFTREIKLSSDSNDDDSGWDLVRGISERVLKNSEERKEVFERKQVRVLDSVLERSQTTTGNLEEMHSIDATVFEEKKDTEEGKAEQPEEEERKMAASSRKLPI